MIFFGLLLALSLPVTAEPPFYLNETQGQQSIGGINQNDRSLSDSVRKIDLTSGGTVDGTLAVDAVTFPDGTTQTTASGGLGISYSSAATTVTPTIGTAFTTVTNTTTTITTGATGPIECCISISLQAADATNVDDENYVRLCRGGASGECYTSGGFFQAPTDTNDRGTVSFCDSPASPLSAGTYTFYIQVRANAGTVDVKGNIAKTRIRCIGK